MKTLRLSVLALLTLLAAGCQSIQPVPASELSGSLGSVTWRISDPKDLVVTNLVISVDTNGAAHLTVGYMSSRNSTNIINASYAGRDAEITALGTQIISGMQAGATMAGAAAGAAMKAP